MNDAEYEKKRAYVRKLILEDEKKFLERKRKEAIRPKQVSEPPNIPKEVLLKLESARPWSHMAPKVPVSELLKSPDKYQKQFRDIEMKYKKTHNWPTNSFIMKAPQNDDFLKSQLGRPTRDGRVVLIEGQSSVEALNRFQADISPCDAE